MGTFFFLAQDKDLDILSHVFLKNNIENCIFASSNYIIYESILNLNMEKKRLYFDMDGVLVNFQSGIDKLSEEVKAEYEDRLDEVPGIFSLMEPMEGAIEAVHQLQELYDVYILSTAPWNNPSAWADKVVWVTKYLDDIFHKRIIITHCKHLCEGDFLIDDRGKNGASEFKGEWIHFGSEKYPNWKSVVDYLM